MSVDSATVDTILQLFKLVSKTKALIGYCESVDILVKRFPELEPWSEGLLRRAHDLEELVEHIYEREK